MKETRRAVYCKHNSNCLSTALCIPIQLFPSFVHKRMPRMKEVQMHRCKQFILGGLYFKLHKLGKDFIAGKSQYREIWLSVIRSCNKKKFLSVVLTSLQLLFLKEKNSALIITLSRWQNFIFSLLNICWDIGINEIQNEIINSVYYYWFLSTLQISIAAFCQQGSLY